MREHLVRQPDALQGPRAEDGFLTQHHGVGPLQGDQRQIGQLGPLRKARRRETPPTLAWPRRPVCPPAAPPSPVPLALPATACSQRPGRGPLGATITPSAAAMIASGARTAATVSNLAITRTSSPSAFGLFQSFAHVLRGRNHDSATQSGMSLAAANSLTARCPSASRPQNHLPVRQNNELDDLRWDRSFDQMGCDKPFLHIIHGEVSRPSQNHIR